jgi:AraC-like DNA-binding protein
LNSSGVRLERAAALLGEQQEPTIEIAMALGYASHSQFFRAFKRWTNMTPTDFRQIPLIEARALR